MRRRELIDIFMFGLNLIELRGLLWCRVSLLIWNPLTLAWHDEKEIDLA